LHILEARCLRPPTHTWRAKFAHNCYYSTASSARALTGSRWFSSCVGSTLTLRRHSRLSHEGLISPESWPPNFTFLHYFSFRVSLYAIHMVSACAKQSSRGLESPGARVPKARYLWLLATALSGLCSYIKIVWVVFLVHTLSIHCRIPLTLRDA